MCIRDRISAEANEGEQKSGSLVLTLNANNSKTAEISITQSAATGG